MYLLHDITGKGLLHAPLLATWSWSIHTTDYIG